MTGALEVPKRANRPRRRDALELSDNVGAERVSVGGDATGARVGVEVEGGRGIDVSSSSTWSEGDTSESGTARGGSGSGGSEVEARSGSGAGLDTGPTRATWSVMAIV